MLVPEMRTFNIASGDISQAETLLDSCWLIDLAREVPSNWTLQGFDISASQFPASQFLPHNVSLEVFDAFDDMPDDMNAKFDIVHIRAFAAVVKGGDPSALIRNLLKMLSRFPRNPAPVITFNMVVRRARRVPPVG